LMILMLALTSGEWLDRLISTLPRSVRQGILNTIRTTPPASLGRVFDQD